jgi:NAD(P)-dependent dehydrogenase (short-subunit alcohol dehydrogenase family)
MSLTPLAERLFSLSGRVVVITGATGLLGVRHAEIIAAAQGIPILVDLNEERIDKCASELSERFPDTTIWGLQTDITQPEQLEILLAKILDRHHRVDVLINNAARNPKVENTAEVNFSRVENFPLLQWDEDLDVGLKGAFLCSQIFGGQMARSGSGVILNICSEYGINAPNQRLYHQAGLAEELQPVKPVSYTVVKSGLLGMTRYFATYWAHRGVRVNAITVAGVQTTQPAEFIARYVQDVPLGRMAQSDEYQGSILYLCADASKFMNGANLIVDGGKSCW